MCFGDVSDPGALAATAFSEPVDVVVSCLASRTGGKVLASLEAGQHEAMHVEMLANKQSLWMNCHAERLLGHRLPGDHEHA